MGVQWASHGQFHGLSISVPCVSHEMPTERPWNTHERSTETSSSVGPGVKRTVKSSRPSKGIATNAIAGVLQYFAHRNGRRLGDERGEDFVRHQVTLRFRARQDDSLGPGEQAERAQQK